MTQPSPLQLFTAGQLFWDLFPYLDIISYFTLGHLSVTWNKIFQRTVWSFPSGPKHMEQMIQSLTQGDSQMQQVAMKWAEFPHLPGGNQKYHPTVAGKCLHPYNAYRIYGLKLAVQSPDLLKDLAMPCKRIMYPSISWNREHGLRSTLRGKCTNVLRRNLCFALHQPYGQSVLHQFHAGDHMCLQIADHVRRFLSKFGICGVTAVEDQLLKIVRNVRKESTQHSSLQARGIAFFLLYHPELHLDVTFLNIRVKEFLYQELMEHIQIFPKPIIIKMTEDPMKLFALCPNSATLHLSAPSALNQLPHLHFKNSSLQPLITTLQCKKLLKAALEEVTNMCIPVVQKVMKRYGENRSMCLNFIDSDQLVCVAQFYKTAVEVIKLHRSTTPPKRIQPHRRAKNKRNRQSSKTRERSRLSKRQMVRT